MGAKELLLAAALLHGALCDECPPCSLEATNWRQAQGLYRSYRYDHSAAMIHFVFNFGEDDIVKLREEKGQVDTFDPTLWAWVSSRGRYLLELPMDYDIASLGLLSLKVFNVDVNVTKTSCFEQLKGHCLGDKVAELILKNLTFETGRPLSALQNGGAVCRSAYIHPAFMSRLPVCAGMKCCSQSTKEEHQRDNFSCNTVLHDNSSKIKEVHLAFGIIFSALFYFAYFGWKRFRLLFYARRNRTWDWLRRYLGFDTKHYTTFILQGRPGARDHWIALSEDDLLSRSGSISFADLIVGLGASKRVARAIPVFKILLWAIFLTVIVLFAIPYFYQYKARAMILFRNGEEIAFNLRAIPVGWLHIPEFLWPKGVAAALLVAIFVNLFIDLVCAFSLCLCPSPEKRPAKLNNKEDDSPSAAKTCCMVFIALLIAVLHIAVGVLYIAAVIYPLTQVFVFVLTAALVNADIVIPYFVAAFFAVYYIYSAYLQIKQPFIEMKHLVYDEYLHFDETVVAYEYEHFGFDPVDPELDSASMANLRQIEPSRTKLSRKTAAHLLVLYHKDNCARVLKKQYLEMCHELIDAKRHLMWVVIRLVLILSFIGLVLFTLLTFHPPGDYLLRTVENIIAGTVALVAISIPIIYNRMKSPDELFMKRTWKRYEIERYLGSLVLDFDAASKRSSASLSVYSSRMNSLHVRPRHRTKMRSVSNPGSDDERYMVHPTTSRQFIPNLTPNGWLPKSSGVNAEWPGATRIHLSADDSLPSSVPGGVADRSQRNE